MDRAGTPSVQTANRHLLRQLGFPAIPPEDLARIGVPPTLIWGRHVRVMQLRAAEEANARYGWPLHVIEDAGHLPQVEQPQGTLQALQIALAPS